MYKSVRLLPASLLGSLLVLLAAIATFGAGAASAAPSRAACGVELWALKTMTDPAASSVDLVSVPTTVAAIDALPLPADPTQRAGDQFELRAWSVTAYLTGYKLEADQDYHLVLDDGHGHTLIAEIPVPACAAGSSALPLISAARTAFDSVHPQSAECFACLHQLVTVSGVGFYDRPHGQNGVAPNAAELHPVIGFGVGGSTPTPAPTPTPKPTPGPAPAPPKPDRGSGCKRYPGHHWYHHVYHRECRPEYYTTP